MKKNVKKLLAVCLICLLVVSLVACGKGAANTDKDSATSGTSSSGTSNSSTSNNSTSKDASSSEEPTTLSAILRLNAEYVIEGNPIIEELEKRLNIKLEIEAPPVNNYGDRLNIVMASGDLPDIIFLNNMGTLYQGWAADGLLLRLDEYFENSMPNAKAVLTEEELAHTRVQSVDNGLYSLPRVQTKPWDNIIYRKDWLDKLGLKVPTTPKEFAEVMLAFAKNDPDGNGKNDTYGWSYNRVMARFDRNLVNGFNMRPNSVPDENGNYELMQAQEGYFEFMDWLRDMYEKGAMDPEWYLTKMYEDDDKFYAGQIGAAVTNKQTNHITKDGAKVKEVNPDAELIAGPPLRPEGQTVSNVYYNPQIWGNYGISADSEHIDKAIEFLDYGYTDEYNELVFIGIEGITYSSFDREKRICSRTEEQQKAYQKYCSSYATINYQRQDKGLLLGGGSTDEESVLWSNAYEEIGRQTKQISYLPESMLAGINDASVKITDSGITTKCDEYETKYICGQISRDEFVDFIKNEFIPKYEEYMNIIRGSGINK